MCASGITLLNLWLDSVFKALLIALTVYLFLVLRNVNGLVTAARKSFESVEETAEAVEKTWKLRDALPFGDKDE